MSKKEQIYIYGTHAVTQALLNRPDVVTGVLAEKDFIKGPLESAIHKAGIQKGTLAFDRLPKEVREEANHQGVIATIIPEKLLLSLGDFIEGHEVTPASCVVVLGEIQDPQNVGSIIRSAAAFGASAVIIPEHNQAGITGTVIKVSAGMAFNIPLVQVGNVNDTLIKLKEKGFWIYGLTGEGSTKLSEEKFEAATVIVVGNEGSGIREKTLSHCDITLSIGINKNCESLNAGVSTALALYQWSVR